MTTMPNTVDVIDLLLSFKPMSVSCSAPKGRVFTLWDLITWVFARHGFWTLNHRTGFRCYDALALLKVEG